MRFLSLCYGSLNRCEGSVNYILGMSNGYIPTAVRKSHHSLVEHRETEIAVELGVCGQQVAIALRPTLEKCNVKYGRLTVGNDVIALILQYRDDAFAQSISEAVEIPVDRPIISR